MVYPSSLVVATCNGTRVHVLYRYAGHFRLTPGLRADVRELGSAVDSRSHVPRSFVYNARGSCTLVSCLHENLLLHSFDAHDCRTINNHDGRCWQHGRGVCREITQQERTSSGRNESVVSEFDSATTRAPVQAMGDVLQKLSNVIANVGTAVLENMKAEQDMRFFNLWTHRIERCSLPRNSWHCEWLRLARRGFELSSLAAALTFCRQRKRLPATRKARL